MIKFRISLLCLLLLSHSQLTFVRSNNDIPISHNDTLSNDSSKSRALLLKRHQTDSSPAVNRKIDHNENGDDQNAIASERIGARYLPPPSSGGGYFEQNSVNCHTCNSVPWIPIIGRSLKLNSIPQSSHFNSLETNRHQEKSHYVNQKQFYPPIDQYGAPQAHYMYPPLGEVVDFMLPPPFKLRNVYKPPKQKYFPPKTGPQNYLDGSGHFGGKTRPSSGYGPPNIYNRPYFPTPTHLRPVSVSQDFQPPLPTNLQHIDTDHSPASPPPSDSYGNLLNNLLVPPHPSDSYGTPIQIDHHQPSPNNHEYVEPVALGSSENVNYDKRLNYHNFIRQNQNELYQTRPTNVQVVPSVIIADYTASVEHPINLIQSPILDLNVKQTEQLQSASDKQPVQATLNDHPIIVADDSYTAASSRTSTNTSTVTNTTSTTTKRHNEKDQATINAINPADSAEVNNLSESLIHSLIRDQHIITDPKNQIISIKKINFDPTAGNQQTTNSNYWSSLQSNTISTVMVPPKPIKSHWTATSQNHSQTYHPEPPQFQQQSTKNPKKLQIIVPYLRAPEKELMWLKQLPKSTAIYNKEYSTLAPIFIPPPMSTEVTNLWTKLAEDMRLVELQKEEAQGFSKKIPTTTEVYNIKDFVVRNQDAIRKTNSNVGISMDVINDWTQQFYAPTNNYLNFGERIPSTPSTSQGYSKRATTSITTATSPSSIDFNHDHLTADSSSNNPFISKEIEENLLLPLTESTTIPTTIQPYTTTTPSSNNIRYIGNETKASWPLEQITLSNSTHEKVYVVTPQSYVRFLTSTPATAFSMAPKIQNGKINDAPPTMTRISVRVESPPEIKSSMNGVTKGIRPVKVVYSEWPHLINNLETTTPKPTTRHPLFGLMDLAPYTVSFNGTVETIGGHSKVAHATSPMFPESTSPATRYFSTSTISG